MPAPIDGEPSQTRRAVEEHVVVGGQDGFDHPLELVLPEQQIDEGELHVREADVTGCEIKVGSELRDDDIHYAFAPLKDAGDLRLKLIRNETEPLS
jgi:hypothetical protein